MDIPLYVSDFAKAGRAFDWRPERTVPHIVEDIHRWLRRNEAGLKFIFA